MQTYHIGILTVVKESEYRGETSYTAWIESDLADRVYFRSNQLVDSQQKNRVKNKAFISFTIRKNPAKVDRLDALKCSILSYEDIAEQLISFGLGATSFIISKADRKLVIQLHEKVKEITQFAADEVLGEKLRSIKSMLASSLVNFKEDDTTAVPKSNPSILFLDSIFQTNSEEYNKNLVKTLAAGIKEISQEEVYQQAKYLLEYGKQHQFFTQDKLNDEFYEKASPKYKFYFWLDGLVEYVDPLLLKAEFENAPENIKSKIQNRLGFSDFFPRTGTTREHEKGFQDVYFKRIRSKIIHELNKAEKDIKIAVAWFTNEDLFDKLCQKLREKIDVELIIINDFINNWENGLPFQKFINEGGKLYLAEFPQIMHHKFCIIDNKTLLNGSYNWTYCAEDRNDENVMIFKDQENLVSEFNKEFVRLKDRIGVPVQVLERFDLSRIVNGDFFSASRYLSKDLTYKATVYKKSDPLYADRIAREGLKIDAKCNELLELRKEIEGSVRLESEIDEASKAAIKIKRSIPAIDSSAAEAETIPSSANVSPDKEANEFSVILEKSNSENTLKVNEQSAPNQGIKTALYVEAENIKESKNIVTNQASNSERTSQLHDKNGSEMTPIYPNNTFSNQATHNPNDIKDSFSSSLDNLKNLNTKQKQERSASDRSLSTSPGYRRGDAPDSSLLSKTLLQQRTETRKELKYSKLKIQVLLDISGSMKNLYEGGLMQKIVEKTLALAILLTESENVEVAVFNDSVQQLAPLKRINFEGYINGNIKALVSGGTEIHKPLEIVKNNYINKTDDRSNVFVIIFTDGDDNNTAEMVSILNQCANQPFFWQFVGMGSNFDKLKKTLMADSNLFKNVDFFQVSDVENISFSDLCSPFMKWFANGEKVNIIIR